MDIRFKVLSCIAVLAVIIPGCGKKVATVKEIVIKSITANSTLDTKKAPWDFHPIYLMDNNPDTVWQEGVDNSYGEGTYITFDFEKPIGFNVLKVLNGFARFESYAEENGQFKDVEISAEMRDTPGSKKGANASFKKVAYVKDPKTGKAVSQEELVKLHTTLIGDRIIITLKSAHPGTKYKDTCLSEVKFGLEDAGKVEIFPNNSMDLVKKQIDELKLYQTNNWIFHGLKETTKNAPDCSDLRFYGNQGQLSLQIYHNGTISRTPATGYDNKGSYREYLPAMNGSYTVEGFDKKGVSISVKNSSGAQESWTIALVVQDDDNWNSMKTEFGTDFNRMIKPAGSCYLVKIDVRDREREMKGGEFMFNYYTFLSRKFDCNSNCAPGQ